MVIIRTAIVAAATLVLAGCGGGSETKSEQPPAAARKPPAASAMAKTLYANECVICHGQGGRGDGTMVAGLSIKPRSFAADTWRFVDFAAGDDAVRTSIATVLRDGISDAMMPAYGSRLSDAEIAGLVDYVLELRAGSGGG